MLFLFPHYFFLLFLFLLRMINQVSSFVYSPSPSSPPLPFASHRSSFASQANPKTRFHFIAPLDGLYASKGTTDKKTRGKDGSAITKAKPNHSDKGVKERKKYSHQKKSAFQKNRSRNNHNHNHNDSNTFLRQSSTAIADDNINQQQQQQQYSNKSNQNMESNLQVREAYEIYQEKKMLEIQNSKNMVDNVRDLDIANLRRGLRFSAKCNNLNRALTLYEEMKRRNVHLSNGDLSSIIYLCCSSGNVELALLIYEETVLDSFEVDENTYSILIRGCAEENRIDESCELILHMIKQKLQPRLRSYAPILNRLWENQDLGRSRKIWKHMMEQNVAPLEEQIVNQIVCYGMLGKMKEYVEEISELFDLLAESVISISTESMNKLYTAFKINHGIKIAQKRKLLKQQSSRRGNKNKHNGVSSITMKSLTQRSKPESIYSSIRGHTLEFLRNIFEKSDNKNSNFNKQETAVDEADSLNSFSWDSNNTSADFACNIVNIYRGGNGSCPCCQTTLERITLTGKEEEKVRKALGTIALEKQWTPKYQRRMENNPNVTLDNFASWLDSKPYKFDVVLDAPNIAYFGQNYEDGKFRHHQIEKMVNHFQEQGKNVLVVIPAKYTSDIIPNHCKKNKNETNAISEYETNLLNKWEKEGIIYKIPLGQNDDWYWMYATVYDYFANNNNSNKSSKRREHEEKNDHLASSSSTVVITNDHMRDHRLSLLEPRPFTRWRANQVIRYRFKYDYFEEEDIDNENSSTTATTIPSNSDNNNHNNSKGSNMQSQASSSPVPFSSSASSSELFSAVDSVIVNPGIEENNSSSSNNDQDHGHDQNQNQQQNSLSPDKEREEKGKKEESDHYTNHIIGIDFFETDSFSKEIQRCSTSLNSLANKNKNKKGRNNKNRIHVPCEEYNTWLCIDLEQV